MPRKVAIDLRRWKTVEASKSKMLPRVKQVYLLLRTADRSLSWAEYFLEVLSFACEHAQEVVSPTSKAQVLRAGQHILGKCCSACEHAQDMNMSSWFMLDLHPTGPKTTAN